MGLSQQKRMISLQGEKPLVRFEHACCYWLGHGLSYLSNEQEGHSMKSMVLFHGTFMSWLLVTLGFTALSQEQL